MENVKKKVHESVLLKRNNANSHSLFVYCTPFKILNAVALRYNPQSATHTQKKKSKEKISKSINKLRNRVTNKKVLYFQNNFL